MSTATANIDFLSSIPSEVLQASGRYGQLYDLQLQQERAQEHLRWVRELLYEELDRANRDAQAHGGFGVIGDTATRVANDPEVKTAQAEVERLTGEVTQAQAEVGGVVFLPALDNLPKIQKRLAAYNRKHLKLATGQEITLTVTDEKLVLHYAYADNGPTSGTEHADFEHVFAILSGGTPKLPGYEFLARVIPTAHGNVVNKIPAISYGMRHGLAFEAEGMNEDESAAGRALAAIDLTRFLRTGNTCEHCRKIRSRNDLYVVYNQATGETKQVGRTCLRDFMGTNDPEGVLKALEQYQEIFRSMGERSERPVIQTLTFLTHCAAVMRVEGGYKKGLGRDGENNLWNFINKKTYRGEKLYVEPTTADEQMAAAVLRWVREEWEEEGEFPTKVKIALAGASVDERLYGIAGAVFAARQRWLADAPRREAAKAQPEREFIGEQGQRQVLELTITNIKWIDNPYAYNSQKPVVMMADADGNRVVWFASDLPSVADSATTPVIGGTYQIKATVVDHEDHPLYGKSTTVNRCKFEKTINVPAEEGDE